VNEFIRAGKPGRPQQGNMIKTTFSLKAAIAQNLPMERLEPHGHITHLPITARTNSNAIFQKTILTV